MRYTYSAQLLEDLNHRVRAALASQGIVNIAAVAEEVRQRNLAENIALEDIEHLVMQAAQLYGAPMEFDGLTAVAVGTCGPLPDPALELPGNAQEKPVQLHSSQRQMQ